MPRLPKDPRARQRRNRSATGAVLEELPEDARRRPPALPWAMFPTGQPHRSVKRWWRAVWASPMAPRWLAADVEALYVLALLRDAFHRGPTASLAGEIRLQEQRLGLDPVGRRKLEWRIEGPRHTPAPASDEAERRPRRPRNEPDPRSLLRLVDSLGKDLTPDSGATS